MSEDNWLNDYSFYLSRNQLPEGWEVVRMEDISFTVTDGTHKTPNYQKNGIRFISIKNIRPYVPINWDAYEKYITRAEHLELTKRCKPEKNDILFPRIGTLGFAKRIDFDEEVSIFVGLGLIKPVKPYIDPQYLEYYMNTSYVSSLSREKANGTGRMTLPLEESRRFPVPLPPLNEQKRIVARIEELFSELDSGIGSLKTARAQLKVYRQAVLKHAFEGKLTAAWRENKGMADEWAHMPLQRVIEEPKYGTSKKCEYDTPGVGVLRIPNIVSGAVDSADLKFAQFDEDEIETYALRQGDILTIRSNGSVSIVGKCALIRAQDEGFLYAGYLIRIRPIQSKILPEFLAHILSSHALRIQIENKAKSTSGVNNINAKEIKSLTIPVCGIEEQKEVVNILRQRLSIIDNMEQAIDAELEKSEALRQSILKKAFSGHLVPQDPADEPASALLARIRAEKAIVTTAIKKSRTFQRIPKDITMKNLLEALSQENDWVSVSKICKKCGIGTGSTTDEIELFYQQLRDYLSERSVLIERRGDNDWLKYNRSKAA